MNKCKLCEKPNFRLKSKFCSEHCKTKHWRIINSEHVKKCSSEYYETHREQISIKNKKYYKEDREKFSNRTSVYAKANPEKRVAHTNKYNASKLSAIPKELTEEDLMKIDNIYKEAKQLEKLDGKKRHVHHIVPLREFNHLGIFGAHAPWNLEILTEEEHIEIHRKLKELYEMGAKIHLNLLYTFKRFGVKNEKEIRKAFVMWVGSADYVSELLDNSAFAKREKSTKSPT